MIIKKKQINKRNKWLRKIKIKNQQKNYIKREQNNLKLAFLVLLILFIIYSLFKLSIKRKKYLFMILKNEQIIKRNKWSKKIQKRNQQKN